LKLCCPKHSLAHILADTLVVHKLVEVEQHIAHNLLVLLQEVAAVVFVDTVVDMHLIVAVQTAVVAGVSGLFCLVLLIVLLVHIVAGKP